MIFTVKEAKEYASQNKIDEWIYSFLMTEGDNKILGEELREGKPYFTGPIKNTNQIP